MDYMSILQVDGGRTHTIVGKSVTIPMGGLMAYSNSKFETPGFRGQKRFMSGNYFTFEHPQMLGISVQPYGPIGGAVVSAHAYDIQKSREMLDEFVEITGSNDEWIDELEFAGIISSEIKQIAKAKKEVKA